MFVFPRPSTLATLNPVLPILMLTQAMLPITEFWSTIFWLCTYWIPFQDVPKLSLCNQVLKLKLELSGTVVFKLA
jgi:hypothetical protein